jgi:hypothetical protein
MAARKARRPTAKKATGRKKSPKKSGSGRSTRAKRLRTKRAATGATRKKARTKAATRKRTKASRSSAPRRKKPARTARSKQRSKAKVRGHKRSNRATKSSRSKRSARSRRKAAELLKKNKRKALARKPKRAGKTRAAKARKLSKAAKARARRIAARKAKAAHKKALAKKRKQQARAEAKLKLRKKREKAAKLKALKKQKATKLKALKKQKATKLKALRKQKAAKLKALKKQKAAKLKALKAAKLAAEQLKREQQAQRQEAKLLKQKLLAQQKQEDKLARAAKAAKPESAPKPLKLSADPARQEPQKLGRAHGGAAAIESAMGAKPPRPADRIKDRPAAGFKGPSAHPQRMAARPSDRPASAPRQGASQSQPPSGRFRAPLMRPVSVPVVREPPRPSLEERAASVEARLQAQPDDVQKEYLDRLFMSWIHHDSALEGVVYTIQELLMAVDPAITVVPDSSIQPICEEIRRHRAAIDFVRDQAKKKQQLTTDVVKRIYLLLHPEEGDLKTVKYRKDIPQHRLYFHEYAPPDKIAYAVRQVVEWVNDPETRRTRTAVRIAARAHYDLLRTFPFPVDSGKVSRLVMNFILLRAGFPPAIIHSTERQRYYEALKGSPLAIVHMASEALENSIASIEKFLDEQSARVRSFIS